MSQQCVCVCVSTWVCVFLVVQQAASFSALHPNRVINLISHQHEVWRDAQWKECLCSAVDQIIHSLSNWENVGFRSAIVSAEGPELDVFVDQKSDAFFLVPRWLLSIPGSSDNSQVLVREVFGFYHNCSQDIFCPFQMTEDNMSRVIIMW